MNEEIKEIPLTKEEHMAIKSVHDGVANERQQRLALEAIIHKISRANDLPYIPGSSDGTSLFVGRQFVGKKIIKYIKNPVKEEPANVSET